MWFFQAEISRVGIRVRNPTPYELGYRASKARVPRLPVGEMRMILRSLVLTHYQHVTDRRTPYTPPIGLGIDKSRTADSEKIVIFYQ